MVMGNKFRNLVSSFAAASLGLALTAAPPAWAASSSVQTPEASADIAPDVLSMTNDSFEIPACTRDGYAVTLHAQVIFSTPTTSPLSESLGWNQADAAVRESLRTLWDNVANHLPKKVFEGISDPTIPAPPELNEAMRQNIKIFAEEIKEKAGAVLRHARLQPGEPEPLGCI
jgi:hypothetical protein